MTTIKRGDVTTLTFNLGVDLDDYSGATVILRRVAATTSTEITGTIDGQTVTCDLTAEHTADVGDFRVEVEMTPGPHTYPSDGYRIISVVEDLNP